MSKRKAEHSPIGSTQAAGGPPPTDSEQPGTTGQPADKLFGGSPGEEAPAPNIPSSLGLDRQSSAARSGRAELEQRVREHNETSPAVTGGDVDADWESAYSVGDEAPGGDNQTPDQQSVEEVAGALGVEYEDTEELKGVDKIGDRDRHRWELDPASSEDYKQRAGEQKPRKRKS